MLEGLSMSNRKTLLVLPESNKNVFLSGRNIQNTKITTAQQMNTYDVLNADNLLLSEGSIEKIEKILN